LELREGEHDGRHLQFRQKLQHSQSKIATQDAHKKPKVFMFSCQASQPVAPLPEIAAGGRLELCGGISRLGSG
jgi:hypothetical protein